MALTIALVTGAASVWAQEAPPEAGASRLRGIEITPFVSLSSNTASGIGAAVRWPLISNFSLEVETAGRWSEIAALSASANLLFDLPAFHGATPYLAAGIGLDQYGFAMTAPGGGVSPQTGTAVTVNAGGGVRVPVSDNWGMRTDARWSNGLGAKAPERWRLYNGVTYGRLGR